MCNLSKSQSHHHRLANQDTIRNHSPLGLSLGIDDGTELGLALVLGLILGLALVVGLAVVVTCPFTFDTISISFNVCRAKANFILTV